MAQICIDRHQNIGKFICLIRTFSQLIIDLSEILKRLILMTEYFYNLLPLHHFLDISVDLTQILLLPAKIRSGPAAQFYRCKQHERHNHKRYNRERNIQDNHTDQSAAEGYCRIHYLRNTLTHKLS